MVSTKRIDELNFISESGRKYLRQLAHELAFGSVVLFAGAGLSFNASAKDGGRNRMPSWQDLAARFRARLDADLRDDADPLKLADYFETKFGRTALNEAVREAVQDEEHEPGRVHKYIVRLNFDEIITTNYDTLIERAFREQLLNPQVVVDGYGLVRWRRGPRIIKMHGCLQLHPSGLVVSQSDFLAYAETHPWVQVSVTKNFVESTVLFIGFGLNDPAFQAINERVLSMLGPAGSRLAFSLQHRASKIEIDFWKKRQVQIIDLFSGEPAQLDDQLRVQRVLDALLEFQEKQSRWPRRRGRELLEFSVALTEADAQDRMRGVALLALRLLASGRSDSELEALRTNGAGMILDICARKAFADNGAIPDLKSVFRELVLLLKQICRMDDIESPGVQLTPRQWAPIRELACLLLGHQFREDARDQLDCDLILNLRILAALLSLELVIVAPRLAVEAMKLPDNQSPREDQAPSHSRKNAAALFSKALDGLDLSCLATHDMQIRSRLIALICLFGPLQCISTIAATWVKEGAGAGLEEERPTPVEYRLLPLSFYGIPKRRCSLYREAAESLWSRQLAAESPAGVWRIESALRYQYLRQAAPEAEDWVGVRYYGDRLARALGQFELDRELADFEERNASVELLAVLQEINRGWLFDCPAPEEIEQAWAWAEEKCAKGKAAEIPWEALVIFTLPIEGKRLFERWPDLLEEAWRAGDLDTTFLVEYLARRIGDGRFETPVAGFAQIEDSSFGCYECGMAHLVQWLGMRISYEQKNSELLNAMERLLLSPRGEKSQRPLAEWLCQTRYAEVRSYLLESLFALRPHTARAVHAVLRTWVSARLRQPPQSSSLQLSALNPSPAELAMESHEIGILLGLAQAPRTAGTQFRNDLLKWLVRWSEELDTLVLATLARQVHEILRGHLQNIDWLPLAAEVRLRPRLCQMVEDLLRRVPGDPSSLSAHVKARLRLLPQQQSKTLQEKGVLLKFFGPFAEDFDDEISGFVDASFSSERLGPEARNDAVELLTALLQKAPQELQTRSAASWRAALSHLIQQGAIGRGLSREQLAELDPATRQALQDNLISRLNRDEGSEPPQIIAGLIGQIEEKIRLTETEPLVDLEQELIRSFQSRAEALALCSLGAVASLCQNLPGFLERNRARIRRTRLFVEKRGGYRQPSRFAELLEELRQIEEGPGQPPISFALNQ